MNISKYALLWFMRLFREVGRSHPSNNFEPVLTAEQLEIEQLKRDIDAVKGLNSFVETVVVDSSLFGGKPLVFPRENLN